MPEHERLSKDKRDKVDGSRQLKRAPEPSLDHGKATEEADAGFIAGTMERQIARLSEAGSDEERARLVGQLQQAYGNQYVQQALEAMVNAEAIAGGDNPEPDQKVLPASEGGPSAAEGVRTVLQPGYSPETTRHLPPAPQNAELRAAHDNVTPGGTPDVVEPGAGNTCKPGARTLDWEVVADGEQWRPNVRSLTLSGTINIKPWPDKPNDMVVPNTPNPVDGGNINDTENSHNNWEYVIQDLEDYDTAGGGAGLYWHSTEASRAHEWAHWNTDWVAESIVGDKGGNWGKTNADIEKLRVSKADSGNTAAEGRAKLEPLVNDRMSQFNDAARDRWNALPDTPGAAGGAGYKAGARVLQSIVSRVRVYGWLLRGRALVTQAVAGVGSLLRSLF